MNVGNGSQLQKSLQKLKFYDKLMNIEKRVAYASTWKSQINVLTTQT